MQNEYVTLREIALTAKVSHSTVSRALRNSPSISAATRKRIAEIAHGMGYRTNPLVAAWMAQVRQKTSAVRMQGVLAYFRTWESPTSYHKSYFKRCEVGAHRRAAELGYRLEPMHAHDFAGGLRGLDRMVRNGVIDGVVFAQTMHDRFDSEMEWDSVAASVIGFHLEDPPLHRACVDGFANMSLAMRKLTAAGYRRIGLCLTKTLDEMINHVWVGSYLGFQLGLPPDARIPPYIGDWPGKESLTRWFDQHRPDVIIQCQKMIRECICELRHDIPAELGLVDLNVKGPDDSMTGIDQDLESVGAVAVEQVVAQLHRNERGIPVKRQTVLVPGVWREGTTIRSRAEVESEDEGQVSGRPITGKPGRGA